jgi:nucleoside-diphosphate-sugar epimerase
MVGTVFVTGAAGFIGGAVAIAFREAGYRVYGLVRSSEQGLKLKKNEIIPVIGTQGDTTTYRKYVEQSEVIIDTVIDFTASPDVFSVNRLLLDVTAETSQRTAKTKTYLYTSGLLVYGAAQPEDPPIRDETTPPRNSAAGFQARLQYENLVTTHSHVTGVVVRPGYLYGCGGSYTAPWFGAGSSEKLVIRGDKDRRWSWVHVWDLTQAYLRIASSSPTTIKGQIFNIVGDNTPTVAQVMEAAAKVAGFKGVVEYGPPDDSDWNSVNANFTVVLSSEKAFKLLGWRPTHPPLLDDLEVYYQAYLANK